MAENYLHITPKTKIGELLDVYPELEQVLIEMSPAFEKLKNPVLRRTVAKVATLQQVAVIGNLKVDEVVNKLRISIGQEEVSITGAGKGYLSLELPEWFDKANVGDHFDATDMINKGESPVAKVFELVSSLKENRILELQTPFVPAPLLDMLAEKGCKYCVVEEKESFISYIIKKSRSF